MISMMKMIRWILIDFRDISRSKFIANIIIDMIVFILYFLVKSRYSYLLRLYCIIIILFRLYCLLSYSSTIVFQIRRPSFFYYYIITYDLIFLILYNMYYIIIIDFILFIVSNDLVYILIYFIDD